MRKRGSSRCVLWGPSPHAPAGGEPRTPGRVTFSGATAGTGAGLLLRGRRTGVNDPFGSCVSADEGGSRPAAEARRNCFRTVPQRRSSVERNPAGGLHVILGTCRRRDRCRTGPAAPARRVTEAPRVTVRGRMSRCDHRTVTPSPGRPALVHCGPSDPRSVHSRFFTTRSAVWNSVVHPSAGTLYLATFRNFSVDTAYYASSSSCYLAAIFWRGTLAACGWKSL
jgi:hypothetical protein